MILDIVCQCGNTLKVETIERSTFSDMKMEVTMKPCADCLSEAKDMGREDAGKEEA